MLRTKRQAFAASILKLYKFDNIDLLCIMFVFSRDKGTNLIDVPHIGSSTAFTGLFTPVVRSTTPKISPGSSF